MQKFLYILIFTSLIFLSRNVSSQENILFGNDTILELELYLDLEELLKDRGDDREKHEVEVAYLVEDSSKIEIEAKIKVRGNFRRQKENCDFPPFSIFFNEDMSNSLHLEHWHKVFCSFLSLMGSIKICSAAEFFVTGAIKRTPRLYIKISRSSDGNLSSTSEINDINFTFSKQ